LTPCTFVWFWFCNFDSIRSNTTVFLKCSTESTLGQGESAGRVQNAIPENGKAAPSAQRRRDGLQEEL
jgi:hypothetical protein